MKVNHHKRKASYLQSMSSTLIHSFNGRVPEEESLLRQLKGQAFLPSWPAIGVGEKSALLYVQTVVGRAAGIAVDTHLHKIANALGWVSTQRPAETRKQLEERVPEHLWCSMNPLVVGSLPAQPSSAGCSGFGQELAQEKAKILRKSVACSKPALALELLAACGMDVAKEPLGDPYGLVARRSG